MSRSKVLPRCTMRTRNGTACGRRVSDGSIPPICHIHRGTNGGIAVAASEPDDLLGQARRMLKDKDATVRLRAIDLCLKLQERAEKRCGICADRAEQDRELAALIDRLSDDERARALSLILELKKCLGTYQAPNVAEPVEVTPTTSPADVVTEDTGELTVEDENNNEPRPWTPEELAEMTRRGEAFWKS